MRHLIAALALSACALAQADTPAHVYLMNDTSDLMGGPSLTTLGGDFTTEAGHYVFAANQGFSVEGAIDSSVYTLDFVMRLDTVDGYRRLVDFKALTSDTGFYNLNAHLNFYNVNTGIDAVFTAGTEARVTLTRDAAGTLTGYVNGVQQFQFDDSASGLATFSAGNQIGYFFRDDNAVANEASGGSIDYLSIYNTALSANDVAGITSPVPEPASALLAAAGLGLLALRRRR